MQPQHNKELDIARSLRILVVLFFVITALCGIGYAQFSDFCWRDTNTRGAGKPLDTNTCSSASLEKDPKGLLCYPKCKAGYKGVGPVCWESCPAGYRDDGGFCAKPQAYGRGGGYPWKFGDPAFKYDEAMKRCKADNPQGCEMNGLIAYPKCKAGFHAVGSNICSPDCLDGMKDMGVSCTKQSYGRGAGEVLDCPSGMERSGLLCYPKCKANSDGVGPVCWERCPSDWKQCGMGCAKTAGACATATTDQVVSVLSAVGQIATEIVTAGAASGAMQEINQAKGIGVKTAEETAKDAATASKTAQDLVGKLNLKDAFKLAKKGSITKEGVAGSLKNIAIPATNAGKAKVAANALATAPATITTIADISQSDTLTDAQKNFQIAQTVLGVAGVLDPTGVSAIVDAYTKPKCSLEFANSTSTDTTTTKSKVTTVTKGKP